MSGSVSPLPWTGNKGCIQIHIKSQFHCWRLVGIWNKAAVGIVSIAEQLGSQRYSIIQPHS